jgi:hypothetical protein
LISSTGEDYIGENRIYAERLIVPKTCKTLSGHSPGGSTLSTGNKGDSGVGTGQRGDRPGERQKLPGQDGKLWGKDEYVIDEYWDEKFGFEFGSADIRSVGLGC